LLRSASKEYGYSIPLASVARIWKGGCIIRAKLLDLIMASFTVNPELVNLILDQGIAKLLAGLEKRWRDTVRTGKEVGIPLPAIASSLDYYDAYRSERLPANLVQLLRDRFGAHGYERSDRTGQFHTHWE